MRFRGQLPAVQAVLTAFLLAATTNCGQGTSHQDARTSGGSNQRAAKNGVSIKLDDLTAADVGGISDGGGTTDGVVIDGGTSDGPAAGGSIVVSDPGGITSGGGTVSDPGGTTNSGGSSTGGDSSNSSTPLPAPIASAEPTIAQILEQIQNLSQRKLLSQHQLQVLKVPSIILKQALAQKIWALTRPAQSMLFVLTKNY